MVDPSGTPQQGRSSWRSGVSTFGSDAFRELGLLPVVFFSVVIVAAGASGVVLLIAPGSTDRYFSWTLRPPAAAALIGGFYLVSAVVFAWALTLPWRQARSLVVGVLGLAVPTLVLTIVHNEVFDFSRWQALAWVGLFATAPVSAGAMLALRRGKAGGGPALSLWSRGVLAMLAVVLATVAVLVWLDPTRDKVTAVSPGRPGAPDGHLPRSLVLFPGGPVRLGSGAGTVGRRSSATRHRRSSRLRGVGRLSPLPRRASASRRQPVRGDRSVRRGGPDLPPSSKEVSTSPSSPACGVINPGAPPLGEVCWAAEWRWSSWPHRAAEAARVG